MLIPNSTTYRRNLERVVVFHKMAEFIAVHAAELPEMRTSHDGITGHYWEYQKGNQTMREYVAATLRVLFDGVTDTRDVTMTVHRNGRLVHVRRNFGHEMSIVLAYVWADNDDIETETPTETVESALLSAWQRHHDTMKEAG